MLHTLRWRDVSRRPGVVEAILDNIEVIGGGERVGKFVEVGAWGLWEVCE